MYGTTVGLLCWGKIGINHIRYHSHKKKTSTKLLEFLATMPKVNNGRISDAQRQRINIQKKSEKYGSSTVYLQVLGSGARGVPNTLYLFTDQKRYLFNCGECTQRLAHEHKVKLSRLEHVFITNKTWQNIGGLPGLSLTLQDVGVPKITLHGPEGLDELYNATKRFVIMKDMQVKMANCKPTEEFQDNVMSVKYVLLGPKSSSVIAKKPKLNDSPSNEAYEEFLHDDTDYYKRGRDADKKSDMNKITPSQVLQALQGVSECVVAYICTLHKRLGTLDLAKCVEFGVQPGPLLGQLKSGKDVVLPNGKLVLSKDVKTADDPGPVFIVLEVPDISYLDVTEFLPHFDDGANPPENIPTVVVHFTPPHVLNLTQYRKFMSCFGNKTQHILLNEQNTCLGSEAVHRTQQKLHLLDQDIFPLLKDLSIPTEWNTINMIPKSNSPTKLKCFEDLKKKIAVAQFQKIINLEGQRSEGSSTADIDKVDDCINARSLTIYHLRPKIELDRSQEPKLHIQDYLQEAMNVDGFSTSLEQFRKMADESRLSTKDAPEYPKVVFLGTGSCIPSKTRNTSAIIVLINEDRSILLDCGEGTFGQLVRFFGQKKVDSILRSLKAIYISHLHADHHIGLIGVLQARKRAFNEVNITPEPVYLLAPGQIMSWLTMYDNQFEAIKKDFTLIPNQSLLQNAASSPTSITPAILASIGLQEIKACLVSHCPNAFGVSLLINDFNKVTYSGDTIPCDELAVIGENSTLLIHEATMEDELADEARMKMHSTTSQAIEMGQKMNAKYTILTHFSQRYARLPRLSTQILNDNKSVGIAFDNMQVTISDLGLLPQMYAPLQLIFADHCVEMELKAESRARKKIQKHSSRESLNEIQPEISNNLASRSIEKVA